MRVWDRLNPSIPPCVLAQIILWVLCNWLISIGLDVCLAVMQVIHDGLADSKYRTCPLLVKYVEAGRLGRKSRRGFYDYSTEVPVPTR